MTGWPKVVLALGLTLAPLAAGVVLIAVGERDLGMLFLWMGGGAVASKGADVAMRPKVRP